MAYLAFLPLLTTLQILQVTPATASKGNPAWIHVSFAESLAPSPVALCCSVADVDFADTPQAGSAPAVAVEYSHGYTVRLRIHRDASFAMLPLFGAEAVVGQKLFNDPSSKGLKTTHGALNVGILGLFAVDSVTGLWNLKESWHEPKGHVRRLVHGLLMLAADSGFVATSLLAPNRRDVAADSSAANTHRTVAVTSISVATVGYLIMVFR